MEYSNKITFKVSGRRALFSDPLTRVGGEKFTYPIPTYEALKGITESIYWKPTFIWVIDSVRVMKKIETECVSIRPIRYNGGKKKNDLAMYTYLRDVEYIVQAHFEWNENRPDLACDRNENKHFSIAKRMIEKGGRRDIFLGTRECQAYVEPCNTYEKGYYDDCEIQTFGLIIHGISYPDETGKNELSVRLWPPVMRKGFIEFPRPDECKIIRRIRDYNMKTFIKDENFNLVDNLFLEEGGDNI